MFFLCSLPSFSTRVHNETQLFGGRELLGVGAGQGSKYVRACVKRCFYTNVRTYILLLNLELDFQVFLSLHAKKGMIQTEITVL